MVLKRLVLLCGVGLAGAGHGAEPLIDNDHVTVWDCTEPLPRASHDYVEVSLSRPGTARFGHRGTVPGRAGRRSIVIELKDLPTPTLVDDSGLPPAFPRAHALRLFENDEVVVWDYLWRPGEATPMHFHDKDAVVVFEADGALAATTPDGRRTVTPHATGEVRFNPRGRVHAEVLASGAAHAVITELK